MIFAIGTKVKLIHTGDTGTVTAWLDGGMLNVRLHDDDMEIPAFPEDLARLDEEQPKVKAKVIPAKQEPVKKEPERPVAAMQYTILKSVGIQLAFEPVIRHDGSTEKYLAYLINDTRYDVLVDYEFSLLEKVIKADNGKLAGVSTLAVGELLFDELNDAPVFDIDCQLITTEGLGDKMHKNLKVKPKQFFKKIKTAPLLNKPVHLYRLFENLNAPLEEQVTEDLETYTKRNARPTATGWNEDSNTLRYAMQLAEFEPELDLHIEKLTDTPGKFNKAEILGIQMSAFERYLDHALKLGVERVFIIHGVGKGRLRNNIATRLMQMPEVKSFKNEYHPRYGYGATEVIF